jgi:PAS domain-containing protein
MTSPIANLPAAAPDFAAVFGKTPGLYLVLDLKFDIVAATDAFCRATMTERDDIVGRQLFEVFPDNPSDSAADGVQRMRTSLLKVLKTREPDNMGIQKHDIERRGIGGFEERIWSAQTIPVLGADGYVKSIILSIEDLTEVVNLRGGFNARSEGLLDRQRILSQLIQAKRELAAERESSARLRETLGRQNRN